MGLLILSLKKREPRKERGEGGEGGVGEKKERKHREMKVDKNVAKGNTEETSVNQQELKNTTPE